MFDVAKECDRRQCGCGRLAAAGKRHANQPSICRTQIGADDLKLLPAVEIGKKLLHISGRFMAA